MLVGAVVAVVLGEDPTAYGYRVNGNRCCIGRDNSIRPTGTSCYYLTSITDCQNWDAAQPQSRQSYWRCQWVVTGENQGFCVDYCGQEDELVHDKHCKQCCVEGTCNDAAYDCRDCECGQDPATGTGPAADNEGCCRSNQRCVYDREYFYHVDQTQRVQQVGKCCNVSTTGKDCGTCAEGWHGKPTDVGGCRSCPGVSWDPQSGDTLVCSGHGTCADAVEGDATSGTVCNCDYGFGSADCSVCSEAFPCPLGDEIAEQCSGRGKCMCANSTATGHIEATCHCSRGFRNDPYKTQAEGACDKCASPYVRGTHCEYCKAGNYLHLPATATSGGVCYPCDCGGHGGCNNITGTCECDDLYSGLSCETKHMSKKTVAVLGAVGGSLAALVLLVIAGVVAGYFIDNAVTKCKKKAKKAKKKGLQSAVRHLPDLTAGGGVDGSGALLPGNPYDASGHTKNEPSVDGLAADDLMASMMTRLLDES